MAATGTVTISIDLELAWGLSDMLETGHRLISDRRRVETEYLTRLLDRCDVHDIPLTFATVGHLFLDSCDGVHETLPPTAGLQIDPGTSTEEDPLFYAPDLLNQIRTADTAHEIATHTYSHIICDSVAPAVLDRELQAVAEIHAENGLEPPRSFVAPRNRLPEYEVLRKNGIEIVRTSHPSPATTESGRYAARLRQWLSRPSLAVDSPRRSDGLIETVATPHPSLTAVHLPTGQAKPLTPFRAVPISIRQQLHESYLKRGLEEASERGANLHLWTHLYNLSNDAQWAPIESFLETLARYRDDGLVRIETMGEQARRVTPRSPSP